MARLTGPERAGIWGRRLVVVPVAAVSLALVLVTLPVALPIALAWDGLRYRRLAITRGLMLLLLALLGEAWGVAAGFVAWLFSGVWLGLGRERFVAWNYGLEARYAGFVFAGARRILGAKLELQGHDLVPPGPILLFIRHAALADTILPGALVMYAHGMRLRHVLARGLLWAPGLNVVGTRVDNLFVRRGAASELPRLGELADGLGPADGVVIWPEGMIPTPANLDRSRTRQRQKEARRMGVGTEPHKRPRLRASFEHVLPPIPGGALALLERGAGADVVFCAHVGFEPVTRTVDLLRGGLAGGTVRVAFWRVRRSEVPSSRAERAAWLFEQWQVMDAWVDANRSDVNHAALQ